MSSFCQNLEICIRFVDSPTIPNASAVYLIKILVLISWIGTKTQVRIGISSITFHTRGTMRGKMCIPYAKNLNFYT